MGRWDVVVVGAGLAGLTCAVELAGRGRSVSVVEAGPRPGGFAASFERDGYTFDASLHLLDAVGPGEPNHRLLEDAGVADELTLVQDRWVHRKAWPDHDLWIGAGPEGWSRALGDAFPGQRRGLRRLLASAIESHERLYGALYRWWDGGPEPALPAELTALGNRTAADVAGRHLDDPLARELAGSASLYLGLPPERISAFGWLLLTAGYHGYGAWYLEGGSGALARALAGSLARRGGELRTSAPVRRIEVDGRRVAGVELADGTRLAAAAVVCNAAPEVMVDELLGLRDVPRRWRSRVAAAERSVSAIKVWLGLTRDVRDLAPMAYDTLLRDAVVPAWADGGALNVAVPSLLDPSCCPPGSAVVSISAAVPATGRDTVEGRSAGRLGDELIAAVEQRLLPGLSGAVAAREVASPATFQRATGAPGGAIFGYAHTPRQSGARRLAGLTPIDGLFLASGWTQPGAGCTSAMIAGRNAARRIVGDP